jgi:hypothetical protein
MEWLAVIALLVVLAGLSRLYSQSRLARGAARAPYRRLAEATGLRFVEERERGPTLRGMSGGVELTIFRTQLAVGEWFHCATATAQRPLKTLVVHHRAFPHVSLATRGLSREATGDRRFDKKFEVHGSESVSGDVRAALDALPCPELTVLLQRVAVVWPAERDAPTPEEIDAVRTILEAIASDARNDAYR